MKKILGLVVLSLFAISASAADLMASSTAPTVTQNIVVEGAACPGVGATGFSSTGLLLSCQSGRWRTQKQDKTWLSPAYTLDSAPSGIAGVSETYDLVSRADYQFCAIFRNYFRSYTDSWPGRNMLAECSVIRGSSYWQLRVRADIGVAQCQVVCAD
ncbi:hypothetical protein ACUDPO_35070 (plasmid) [Pseudomonas aeruginosa]|uniref:hypothetical protein n=1 Tax=Pseudomonas aeruginosa TaxID=287 RepID=UPI004046EAEE